MRLVRHSSAYLLHHLILTKNGSDHLVYLQVSTIRQTCFSVMKLRGVSSVSICHAAPVGSGGFEGAWRRHRRLVERRREQFGIPCRQHVARAGLNSLTVI